MLVVSRSPCLGRCFFDLISTAPRGSGAGCSAWCFKHFKILLEYEDTADGLFFACSAFAKGMLPDVDATLFLL